MRVRRLAALFLSVILCAGCSGPAVEIPPAPAVEQAEPPPVVVAEPPPAPPAQGQVGQEEKQEEEQEDASTGDPPTVLAVDPATGEERVVGMAPPDVWAGSLSPDGQWAMLVTGPPDQCEERTVWLMDLTTGQVQETPLDFPSSHTRVVWPEGRLVTAYFDTVDIYTLASGRHERRKVTPRAWEAASPDGRYLLGYHRAYDRERPDWHAPITVLIHDLQTGEDRTFADLAWTYVTHSGAPSLTRLFWTPDGTGVLVNDPRGEDPLVGGEAVLHLDPQTGVATPYTPGAAEVPEREVGPGGFSYRIQGPGPQDWLAIQVRSPSGEERQVGDGLLLGWVPKGELLYIRWAQGGRRFCEGE